MFDPKKLESQFNAKLETVRAFFTNNYSTSNSNITIKVFDFVNTQPGSYAFATNGSTHTQLVAFIQKVVIFILLLLGILKD